MPSIARLGGVEPPDRFFKPKICTNSIRLVLPSSHSHELGAEDTLPLAAFYADDFNWQRSGVSFELAPMSAHMLLTSHKCSPPALLTQLLCGGSIYAPTTGSADFSPLPPTSLRYLGASTNHLCGYIWSGPPLPHFLHHQPDAFVLEVFSPLKILSDFRCLSLELPANIWVIFFYSIY